jgi:phage FluMu protein Com
VERVELKCPKCGSLLLNQSYKFDEENGYLLQFCSNPECDFVRPITATGKIPREIAYKYFRELLDKGLIGVL